MLTHAGIYKQRKDYPYLLRVANRELMPKELEITYKAVSAPITIGSYYKEITLDVFKIATYNIILGLP